MQWILTKDKLPEASTYEEDGVEDGIGWHISEPVLAYFGNKEYAVAQYIPDDPDCGECWITVDWGWVTYNNSDIIAWMEIPNVEEITR